MERCFFEECLLKGVKPICAGHALDGVDIFAIDFCTEYEAGIDNSAVYAYRARTAIAVEAAFLGAGESNEFTKGIEQAHVWRHEQFVRLTVDGRFYVNHARG